MSLLNPERQTLPFPITVEFEQNYKAEYLRNNKNQALKNLRCFPECKKDGHKGQGFCGGPVRVRLLINK